MRTSLTITLLYYTQVAMALKIVEGVSLSLNKDIDMISKCVPVVVQV